MTPLAWAIFLFVVGIILLIAEVFLPTHGVLGVLGTGLLAASVGVTFYVNQWAGLASLLVMVAASPFVCMWIARIWPRTYVGRRLVLSAQVSQTPALPVQIGQVGTAISELRPMGICDFAGQRVEASSGIGIIPAGRQVRVVSVMDRRPIVRVVEPH